MHQYSTHLTSIRLPPCHPVTRRTVLLQGGVTLMGAALLGHIFGTTQAQTINLPGIALRERELKPVFLA